MSGVKVTYVKVLKHMHQIDLPLPHVTFVGEFISLDSDAGKFLVLGTV